MYRLLLCALSTWIATSACPLAQKSQPWIVDTQDQWEASTASTESLKIEEGVIVPLHETAIYRSGLKRYQNKRQVSSMTIAQSPIWQNWEPVKNLGPINLQDAPIFVSMGPNNHWVFGRYGGAGRGKKISRPDDFEAKAVTLEGFEGTELLSTPYENQYDAPGGLKKSLGGYHAWQSRDMVRWVHHGPVSEGFSRWATSAEYVDNKLYLYYDFPNDQDPHLYIDEDLFDGEPGTNMGIAFKDPSHGSDSGIIRGIDGKFHLIYEDWSPICANKRSWDSPLAGHAVSDDGISGFRIVDPAVDRRTTPTGEIGTYKHPHWVKEDPKNYQTNIAEYEIHRPEQDAFGDWAAISIGGHYYLFGDYDPANAQGRHNMSVGWFWSDDIHHEFRWCDHIGKGHPDPDIGFADGRFYLLTQQATDYVSPGPWVETVEGRLGVDTDNDGTSDIWTEWTTLKESYDYVPGFAKQVKKERASLDASDLPEGFGFQFEIKMIDTTENKSKPMIEKVEVSFD